MFLIFWNNKRFLTKYKEELYFILENTKQLNFFTKYNDLTSNSNLSSLDQGKHIRNLSSLCIKK